jgi:hypothetical protein
MSLTGLGPFDITLTFQKGSEIMPGQMAAVDLVAVVMAPQHFKAFVRSLNQTLEAYETLFGALTIPDTETTPAKTADEIVEIMKTVREKAAATSSSIEPPPPSKRSRGAHQKKES